MKKTILTVFAVCAILFAGDIAASMYDEDEQVKIAAVESYTFKMHLKVPRIYNNNQSLGSRKYQTQMVVGIMQLCYQSDGRLVDVRFKDLVNKTHKLSNGKNVTYQTMLDSIMFPRFNAIGSNKTKKFNVASVCFSIAAEPNYNIGQMDEDNGLYLVLSGKGSISKSQLKTLSGYAAGTIGCGCMAYGHVSPTRKIGFCGATEDVDDVASVYGSWCAKLLK